MKIRLLVLNFLCFTFFNVIKAGPASCIQTKDGVIVFTDSLLGVFLMTSRLKLLQW